MPEMRGQDQHARWLSDLCVVALGVLRPTAPLPPQSPAGFVSLLLGMSTALMLSGSVAFAIGFVLLPWVVVMAMVLYVLGVVWDLSVIGRSILWPAHRADDLTAEGGVGCWSSTLLHAINYVLKEFSTNLETN